MHQKLYTSESEYNAITQQRNAEIGILRARALSPFRTNEDDEEDSLACVLGLEQHLLTPMERLARANKIRKTIDAVLDEQAKQRALAHQRGVDYNAYDTIGISTISMKCSQEARIMALERAKQVERERNVSRRRASDSVLEINLKSSWLSSDEEEDNADSLCHRNAYHGSNSSTSHPPSSKRSKMRRRMSLAN